MQSPIAIPSLEQQEELRAQASALGTQFIVTELDLALTFCATAQVSSDASRRKRNLQHAKEAFESANYFLSKKSIPEQNEIRQRLGELEGALKRLEDREEGIAREGADEDQEKKIAKPTSYGQPEP